MPPKKKEGKKAEKKKKEKILEDKTFGLKNKKKSKVVQKFVEQVKKQVDSMGPKKKSQSNTVKEDKKAKKKAEEEAEREMAKLLGIPVSQVRERKKAKKAKVKGKPENAAPAGGEPAAGEDGATGEDGAGAGAGADDADPHSGAGESAPAASAPVPTADDDGVPEVQEEDVWTQEKEIEAERAKLRAKQGGSGTRVTFEAFMRFKRERDRKRIADMAKRKREDYKARGIKRFRTGREIFMQDPSLGMSNPAGEGDDADVDFLRARKTRGAENEEDDEEGLGELERLMRHTAGDGDALAARAAAMVASLDKEDVAEGAVDKDLFMEGDDEEDDDLDDLLDDEEDDTAAGGGGNEAAAAAGESTT